MDLNTIISWFKRGSKPTEAQFAAMFRSFRHKDDPVPMEDVTGLSYALANKSETGHKHTLADITDYDGGNKEVLNAMVANDTEELEAFSKTVGMYYILLESQRLYQYVHDEDTDTDTLTEVDPDGKVVYSAYDANDNLHIYLYNVLNMEFQDVTNEQVDKTIYTNDLDTLITKQLENGIYAVVCLVSQQGNSYGDSYTLTVGDNGSTPNRILESRDGWAFINFIDDAYQWVWCRYSYVGHKHDDEYAAKDHNHEGVYQPAGTYADANHNHDSAYAAKNHIHPQSDITGLTEAITNATTNKQDKTDNSLLTTAKTIVGAINELFNSIARALSFAAVRHYTLDFGTASELIQDVNMVGAITIDRILAFNVARLYITYGTVSHQLIDLTQPISINVPDGAIITWEIERSIDDGLAAVGVRYSINQSNAQ